MTKFIDTTKREETKYKKPTEFVKEIFYDMTTENSIDDPSDWDHVELVSRDDTGFDIMLGYDNGNKSNCTHFLGHWNDGC